MGIPEFYKYQMPESKGAAMQQGLSQGIKDFMAMKQAKSKLQSEDLERQGYAQKMGEESQKFPLDLQKTQADIDKIRDDISMTPLEKQLKVAQIGGLNASTAKTQAEIPLLGEQANTAKISADAKLKMAGYYTAPATALARTLNSPQMQSLISSNPKVAQQVATSLLSIAQNASGEHAQTLMSDGGAEHAGNFIQQNGKLPTQDPAIKASVTNGLQQGIITPEDITSLQKNTSDSLERKTSTAQMLNQRTYAGILDGLFDSGAKLMPSVSKYAGLAGQGKKGIDAAKSAMGENSADYTNYILFTRETAPHISNEMRRTLGGQATDYEGKIFKNLANPVYWDSNPQLAMKQYEYLTNMYRTRINPVLKKHQSDNLNDLDTSEFKMPNESGRVTVISPDGKTGDIPEDQLDEALAAGYTEG